MRRDEDSEARCPFCEIVAGRAAASIVYDDDDALAFLDIQPLTPGHLLVIPKQHASTLAGLDEAVGMWILAIAMRLAHALRQDGVACDAVNLFLSDGEIAGQEIPHVHLHVIPRFAGDPFGPGRPFKPIATTAPSRAELDAIAADLRRALS